MSKKLRTKEQLSMEIVLLTMISASMRTLLEDQIERYDRQREELQAELDEIEFREVIRK